MSAEAAPRRQWGRRITAWAPAAIYMTLIFMVSSFSIQTDWVSSFPLRDKGVHFLEFLGLGVLVAFACRRTWPEKARSRTSAVAFLIAGSWGLFDEFHQAFVPTRSSDIKDLIADALGAAVGTLLCWIFQR